MAKVYLYGIWTDFPEGRRYGELKGTSVEDVTKAHCERQNIDRSKIISVEVMMELPWMNH